MVILFREFPFAISTVAIFKIYSSEKIVRFNIGRMRRGEGGRGRRRDIGVRFNSNEPRNCFTQSAIICLKILPRTTHSPFDMIRNIIQCASPSVFDCAPIVQLLMVTTRHAGYLFLGPCVIKRDRHVRANARLSHRHLCECKSKEWINEHNSCNTKCNGQNFVICQ